MLATLLTVLVSSFLTPGGQSIFWIVLSLLLAIVLLLYSLRLTVQVDTEALRIRFFPIWKAVSDRLGNRRSW
jgi:hypothetical protein